MDSNSYDGFNDLFLELQETIKNVVNVSEVLEIGASELVKVLLKLPKPYSSINKSGYTHLIDSFSSRKNGNEVEVGWGKYYGPMLENGTSKNKSQAHLKPSWERNKDKIYSLMLKKMNL